MSNAYQLTREAQTMIEILIAISVVAVIIYLIAAFYAVTEILANGYETQPATKSNEAGREMTSIKDISKNAFDIPIPDIVLKSKDFSEGYKDETPPIDEVLGANKGILSHDTNLNIFSLKKHYVNPNRPTIPNNRDNLLASNKLSPTHS